MREKARLSANERAAGKSHEELLLAGIRYRRLAAAQPHWPLRLGHCLDCPSNKHLPRLTFPHSKLRIWNWQPVVSTVGDEFSLCRQVDADDRRVPYNQFRFA